MPRSKQFEEAHAAIPGFAHRIKPIYDELDWRWLGAPGPPAESAIAFSLLALLESIEGKPDSCTLESGGLRIERDMETGDYTLMMVIRPRN